MTESEKIRYAREFLDKLAGGIDPTDGSEIPVGDVARKGRIVGCFNYISGILRQVEENGVAPKRVASRRGKFYLTDEEKARIEITKAPAAISEIARHLNNLVEHRNGAKISHNAIGKWLVAQELLEEIQTESGKMKRVPTEYGREKGIFTQTAHGRMGEYKQVLYSSEAQMLIYENIEAIAGADKEDGK